MPTMGIVVEWEGPTPLESRRSDALWGTDAAYSAADPKVEDHEQYREALSGINTLRRSLVRMLTKF